MDTLYEGKATNKEHGYRGDGYRLSQIISYAHVDGARRCDATAMIFAACKMIASGKALDFFVVQLGHMVMTEKGLGGSMAASFLVERFNEWQSLIKQYEVGAVSLSWKCPAASRLLLQTAVGVALLPTSRMLPELNHYYCRYSVKDLPVPPRSLSSMTTVEMKDLDAKAAMEKDPAKKAELRKQRNALTVSGYERLRAALPYMLQNSKALEKWSGVREDLATFEGTVVNALELSIMRWAHVVWTVLEHAATPAVTVKETSLFWSAVLTEAKGNVPVYDAISGMQDWNRIMLRTNATATRDARKYAWLHSVLLLVRPKEANYDRPSIKESHSKEIDAAMKIYFNSTKAAFDQRHVTLPPRVGNVGDDSKLLIKFAATHKVKDECKRLTADNIRRSHGPWIPSGTDEDKDSEGNPMLLLHEWSQCEDSYAAISTAILDELREKHENAPSDIDVDADDDEEVDSDSDMEQFVVQDEEEAEDEETSD